MMNIINKIGDFIFYYVYNVIEIDKQKYSFERFESFADLNRLNSQFSNNNSNTNSKNNLKIDKNTYGSEDFLIESKININHENQLNRNIFINSEDVEANNNIKKKVDTPKFKKKLNQQLATQSEQKKSSVKKRSNTFKETRR